MSKEGSKDQPESKILAAAAPPGKAPGNRTPRLTEAGRSGIQPEPGHWLKLTYENAERLKTETYEREDILQATQDLNNWRSTWLRAIGLAWSDDQLKQELLDDAYLFFRKYCDYTVPKTVQVVVRDDKDSKWKPGLADYHNWQWRLTRNILILNLPQKPEDEGQAAVALAAYEAVGSSYPFTTCC
jgi:ribosomally synthesized peptide (two-chain TOMM family)